MLAVAPCIGTDQMGPKRFGTQGKLAFSFGNVAQDEGAAMAEYAYKKGWRTAAIATDNLLIYFKDVVKAFEVRFKELGGKIVAKESYTAFDKTITNVVSRLNDVKADVIAISRRRSASCRRSCPGLRSLGNNTPILNSWAGDGTYWIPEEPEGDELLLRHVRLGVRQRPEPGRQRARQGNDEGRPPAGHGRLRHRRRRDRRRRLRDQAGRRLDEGSRRWRRRWRSSRRCPTISGLVSFSAKLHTVFGRQYRVMRIENNVPKYVGAVTATSPAKI